MDPGPQKYPRSDHLRPTHFTSLRHEIHRGSVIVLPVEHFGDPEMKEPALSGVPVKYELVTPLGDEDIVD